ncbi:hypothetical protein NCC78_04085 [Micromonospora phytophila]|uniref:hypothetical protein n=1 Tax=Micromonospora phytophila TaxID=709888 RepID=UPI00202F31E6|nr:hypothetical protein [Micromonospora phytophila]MCM0673887.1 hypothetical protein [Micromonospora phytophila]
MVLTDQGTAIPSTVTSIRSCAGPGLRRRRAGLLLLTAVLATGVLTGCGNDPQTTNSAPRASASLTSSTSPSPTASPPPVDRDGDGLADGVDAYPDDAKNTPQQVPITVACNTGEAWDSELPVTPGGDGRPDFSQVWPAKPTSCEIEGAITIVSPTEKAAYKASGYDDQDVSTLYEICAAVDPDDGYAEAGFAASADQIREINAALMLCPKHPYAKTWREAVKRGQVDVDLEADGRLFGPGTFRIGKEIKPGTYVTTDVDGCYWERQNRSGDIIDNYFTNSALRVQVTIRSSDYAFSSRGCGEWRPAR